MLNNIYCGRWIARSFVYYYYDNYYYQFIINISDTSY